MSDLDPQLSCLKCLPRDCCLINPCTHCAPPPPPRTIGRNGNASSVKSPLRPRIKGSKGDLVKGGGDKTGKVSPAVPPSPDTRSPGRSRLEALEAGLFSFKSASMLSDLTGRLTASRSLASNTYGSSGSDHGGDFPSQEPVDPPASQRCLTAPLGPSATILEGQQV